MTAWEQLKVLFTEMSAWTLLLLLLGIVLIIIDAFDTGFDVTGALGILSIVIGITLRMLDKGTLLMFCVMLFIVAGIITVAVFLIFRSAEKGWLSRTALFDKTPAVPYDRTEGTPDFSVLLGTQGETVTPLRPVGKIVVEGGYYDAVCDTAFLDKGVAVEVIEIEGNRIVVRAKK